MKRYIFLAAVVAIAAVSCAKTYESGTPSEGTPITIGAWNDVLTKSRTVGGTAFAANDIFFVYGYTSGAETPFDGTTVSTADGSAWTYSPIRFWSRDNDYYDFYAVSPSEPATYDAVGDLVASHDVTDGTFTSVSLTLAGNDQDILVADHKHVVKADYGQPVQLNFRHINALVDLKVRKGDGIGDNAVLKVTEVALQGIDNIGTFEVTGYNASSATVPNKAIVAWTATNHTGSYTNASGVTAVDLGTGLDSAPEVTTDASSQYLINNLIVMPQDFVAATQQLKLTYSIITGAGTADEQVNTFTDKVYDLIDFDITDYPTDDDTTTDGNQYNDATNVTGWVGGVHYTYIITIDAEAIVFTAQMESWGTDNGYYYILN